MSTLKVFTLSIHVEEADLDALRHVNNVVVLRYIQEAATAHWLSAAPDEIRQSYLWVVRRHEVDYLKPGFLGDSLSIKTWVGEPTAATWERFTEIYRDSDQQLLFSARTVWVLIDAQSGRPRRVDPKWKSWFVEEAKQVD